jgi:flagellar biosynthesis protein FlhG
MAIDKIIAITVLSGKGGVGKSIISLNLAIALGSSGVKTLLFDAGGGDLVFLTNVGEAAGQQNNSELPIIAENVSLYSSSISSPYSLQDENDIEQFLRSIVEMAPGFDCVVFDCLTGAGPLSYALAGLSEISLLVTTPDPTAIAGAYLMARALKYDGLASRTELLINQVESADEAASLKTRFDILTGKFIDYQFRQAGYIHKDQCLAESVLEQQPLLIWQTGGRSSNDFIRLAEKLSLSAGLHFETTFLKSQ